jgi:hypothetical protein
MYPPFGGPATSAGKRSLGFASPPRGGFAFIQVGAHYCTVYNDLQNILYVFWSAKRPGAYLDDQCPKCSGYFEHCGNQALHLILCSWVLQERNLLALDSTGGIASVEDQLS